MNKADCCFFFLMFLISNPILFGQHQNKVEHHTSAHGQRYVADQSKATSLKRLVTNGAARIASWAMNHDHDEAAAEILHDRLDGKSAKKSFARSIG